MPEVRRRQLLSIAAGLIVAPATAKANSIATITTTPVDSNGRDVSAGQFAVDVPPTPSVDYSMRLRNIHTKEKIVLNFGNDVVVTAAMRKKFNRFLRDHYSGAVRQMDPDLIFHLFDLQRSLEIRDANFEVISGYRSPATNEMLRKRGARVARKSLHMSGRAVDIRMAEVKLGDLRDAALDLKAGGVGFYPRSSFLHFDTGRVRRW